MSFSTCAWSPAAGGRTHMLFTSAMVIFGSLRNGFTGSGNLFLDLLRRKGSKENLLFVFALWYLSELWSLLWFIKASQWYLDSNITKRSWNWSCLQMLKKQWEKNGSCFNDTGCYRGVTSFVLPFVNFSKANRPESVSWWLLRFIGSWYMNKRLSWLGKKRKKRQPLRRCWTSRPLWPTACHPSLCHV